MEDDLKEMQEEELQAIQAIYMDDYVDHTRGAFPAEITLKLTPLQSMVGKDVHARLDLRVKYTSTYPNNPPVLTLENSKGISNEQLNELKNELDKMALELCGEVMVLQLAHYIQSILHQHNVPTLSFFEQMIVNQQKQEELIYREKRKREEAKVAKDRELDQDVMRQVKEELQKRDEVLKQEKRKRLVSLSQSPNNSATQLFDTSNLPQRRGSFTCALSKEHKIAVVVFRSSQVERKVFCSACVGHFFDGACTMTAIDETSGKLMSISEWKVKLSNEQKKVHFSNEEYSDAIAKQINSIEQEFYFLKNKLTCNGALLYHSLDIERNGANVSAKLLIDAITGPPLYCFLQSDGLPVSLIQTMGQQLVDILAQLHSKSIVHRDLNLCNTFINSNNEVVICGYAVMRRLSDFCQSYDSHGLEKNSNYAQNSFRDYRKLIKTGKKGDVFNLGLVLLCLYQGHTRLGYPVDIPESTPKLLKSFLGSCLSSSEDLRPTMQQLNHHSFLREKIIDSHASRNVDNQPDNVSNSLIRQPDKDDVQIHFFNNPLVLAKSRLLNEFETMQSLGKGGFGSVIKVRNKLDGNLYAIKRIPLNPKSLHLNKRITREVKLLSRLNHENVVRYFNSWIEAEDINLMETSSTDTDSDFASANLQVRKREAPQMQTVKKKRDLEESLMELNAVGEFAVPEFTADNNVSWCEISSHNEVKATTSSSSDEDSYKPRSKMSIKSSSFSKRSRSNIGESSEGIVFQMDDSMLQFGDMLDSEDSEDENNISNVPTTTTTTTTTTNSDEPFSLQFLYIQMEYCEKSTLRIAIDEDLYKEEERVIRYFREIVEGLAHVHAQGIIHRDLKPFNIFMDWADRIKIGDFGLATSHGNAKLDTSVFLKENETMQSTDDRMTGKVGTALYVAPELCQAKSKIKFSQKVDMYSLGVILFEMCYRPLTTGMERVKLLGSVRTEKIIFPDDFNIKKYKREHYVTSWLLNHNPEERPSATELLESGYVPPKFEDSQLDDLLKHTLNQTNSTRYQRLMSTLFMQPVTPVLDQIYDSDYHGKNEDVILEAGEILHYVRNVVTGIFLKHGGVFIETPLLIPKTKLFDQLNAASFIDQSGLQLCLPCDSRISFARYISRNNINNLRRFYIGKLYRKARIMSAHPGALWECSFDIVTDAFSSMLPESELIYIVFEIIKEFPNLYNRNFYIRLNHTDIMKAIFVQNSFTEEAQQKILEILETARNDKVLIESLQLLFMDLKLADHVINKLISFFMFDGSLPKAKETLQILRKSKTSVSSLAKQAFHDLDRVVKYITNLSVDIPVSICTSFVGYANHYSGIIFQFVAKNSRKRKHGGVDILAVGGCYDKLVESMSRYAESTNLPTSVGVSIAVEKLIMSVIEEERNGCTSYGSGNSAVVCSVTNTPNSDVLVSVLHDLWSANINASLFSYDARQDYTIEEVQEYCIHKAVNHIVALKESDLEYVRVRSRDKDRFNETRVPRAELCDYLNQKMFVKAENTKELEPAVNRLSSILQSNELSFLFTFVSVDKVDANLKKKFTKIFDSKFHHELQQCFGTSNDLQVVAAKLERSELKSVAAYLELNGSYEDFESSVRDIMEMYKDQGPFMKRLCNTLYKVYSESHSVVVLYSYVEEVYKVFT